MYCYPPMSMSYATTTYTTCAPTRWVLLDPSFSAAQMNNQPYEFEFDYSPAWRFVGQHMRWHPDLQQTAEQYVRRTVGAPEGQPIPPVCSLQTIAFDTLTTVTVDWNPYASRRFQSLVRGKYDRLLPFVPRDISACRRSESRDSAT